MLSNSLTLLVFAPLLALIFLLLPKIPKTYYKYITLFVTIGQLLLALNIYLNFDITKTGLVLVENYDWISLNLGSFGQLKINYFLGLDGINVSLILLAGIVLVIGAIASWKIEDRSKGYFALYLLLASTIMGCFMALDFFLFYLFFEFMLLPMYFLIGLWGGPRREYASIKFFLYTLLGSLFILVVIIGLYISVIDPEATAVSLGLISDSSEASPEILTQIQGLLAEGLIPSDKFVRTFNMLHMMDAGNYIPGSILSTQNDWTIFGLDPRLVGFLGLFLGFLIKLPGFPFHTWLPDAHVEAPTPISVVLAGILLKIGGYGIIRTSYSIFPEGGLHFAWTIGLTGVITILYGGLNALAMKDFKKLIAYSSISHMGFVLLGLASLTEEGVNGAIYTMFSHGILASLLFLCVGVLYDRTHDRGIDNYRGLATKMPAYTTIVTIAFFASLGLPGFSGFISELFVLLGAFKSGSSNGLLQEWMAVCGAIGIILGAAYFLWPLQKMFFGKLYIRNSNSATNLTDLTYREKLMMIPLVILTIVFGLFPDFILDTVSPSVNQFLQIFIKH